jgi:hypothetical protein
MAIEVSPFPQTDAFVDVTILNGGGMLGHSSIMHADEPPRDVPMGNWSFYIVHPKSQKKIMWDLGISAVNVLITVTYNRRFPTTSRLSKKFTFVEEHLVLQHR